MGREKGECQAAQGLLADALLNKCRHKVHYRDGQVGLGPTSLLDWRGERTQHGAAGEGRADAADAASFARPAQR